MADDELTTPLGQGPKLSRRLKIPAMVPRAVAALLGLCVLAFVGWIALVDDPFGGEPRAVLSTELRPADPTRPAGGAAKDKAAGGSGEAKPTAGAAEPNGKPDGKTGAGPAPRTVTIIDGASGERREVAIGQGADADSGQGGGAKPKSGAGGAKAKSDAGAGAIDPRLVETSRHGPIPKTGPDGARASLAYAKPLAAAPKPDTPQIAIVVGGLGISGNTTSEALARLPGAVTFGFAPYGTDLERWTTRARGEGHELVLQVPMEPFDFPDNDPGPQTLLTALTAEQNIDRLHWFMSRFQGYVGIANHTGARFTAAEQSFSPVLREIAKRGLIYLDDATSPRSLASQIAGANNVAFSKADVVVDAAPTPNEIDTALARLEAMARQRGAAVGIATALPVSIDRISQWAKAAAGRGVVLVPLSALASKPKPS